MKTSILFVCASVLLLYAAVSPPVCASGSLMAESTDGAADLSAGDRRFQAGRTTEAGSCYERSLRYYERHEDATGLAAAFKGLGQVYARRGEYDKARKMFGKALSACERAGSTKGRADVYRAMAELSLSLREYDRSGEYYDKALALYDEANDTAGAAHVAWGKGQIRLKLGDIPGATGFYRRALEGFTKAGSAAGQGYVWQSLGTIEFYRGENAKALDMFEGALAFFRSAGEAAGENYVYRILGLISMRVGDSGKALDHFTRSLDGYTASEDALGQADALKATGDLYFYTRDLVRSMEMYDRALPFYLKAGEPVGQGNVERSMGDIYYQTGDNDKALEMFGRAAVHYEAARSPVGQGNAYRSIGDVYYVKGEYERSTVMQERAIPLFRQGNSSIGLGDSYRSLGDNRLAGGDHTKALEMYAAALPYYSTARSSIGMGNVHQSMGDSYRVSKDPVKAMEHYRTSLDHYVQLGDIESEAFVLFRMAGIHAEKREVRPALALYEKGLFRLERVRRQAGLSELKKTYMTKVYDHYEDASVFMIENGFRDRAFKYVEAMKARVFLDQLSEGLVSLEKGIDPSLKEKRDELEKKIGLINTQILDLSQKAGRDDRLLAQMHGDREKAREELDVVRREIRYRNPLYASVQYPEPIDMTTLQKKVLRDNEVLLEYFVAAKGTYCFVVGRDRYDLVRLPTESAVLIKKVRDLLGAIRGGLVSGMVYPAGDAVDLYDIVLKPLERYIRGRSVIIVPDGVLALLPFEALVKREEGRTPFLVELYPLKYIQSASVLGILRRQYRKEGARDWFIGFGDPVYDYRNFREGLPEGTEGERGTTTALTRSGYLRSGGSLSRLMGSGEEIALIEKIFAKKARTTKALVRIEAKEEWAKSDVMERYRYIHFSTHGILEDNFQAIALSQIPGSREDGFLTLGEIMNSRFNASLVVLSACETGLGKADRGEGITGLTRAVMYAGSPAAVVSLWSVSDEATRDLMVLFYENLIVRGMSKEKALRQAKIGLIGRSAHPFFWSAFVMYGE